LHTTGGYNSRRKGWMQMGEKVRRMLRSATARSVAKCIALCALGGITSGRRAIAADKGKSCCG